MSLWWGNHYVNQACESYVVENSIIKANDNLIMKMNLNKVNPLEIDISTAQDHHDKSLGYFNIHCHLHNICMQQTLDFESKCVIMLEI